MKLGIRLQIALALSGLLVLAFIPLFAAVASLTRVSLQATSEHALLSSARGAARCIDYARTNLGAKELRSLAESQTAEGGLLAIGVYDQAGRLVLRMGRTGQLDLPDAVAPADPAVTERVVDVTTRAGPALQVFVPATSGTIAILLRREEDPGRGSLLLRMVALYTALFAAGLLVFSYIALTKLIVRPIDAISGAARRVAGGARHFDPIAAGPAELRELARSLTEMTANLTADEQRMRDQIAELERGAQALRQAQDRLIRSERLASVGRLAAGLAHEIGNPIAALIGMQELLLEGGLSASEERDFVGRMRNETERIHRVLRNLLDFARPAASTPSREQEPQRGSIPDAIDDAVALVRPQRAFRDLTIEVDAAPDLPEVALSRERIVQVLLNLLLNAADAAGKGRIRIRVELDPASAAGATGAQHVGNPANVRIAVQDEGPGVDPTIVPRLFEPFVTTKEIGKGTGLGLAVCRGLVESVRGTIHLEESHQPGASFVVTLPVVCDRDERSRACVRHDPPAPNNPPKDKID